MKDDHGRCPKCNVDLNGGSIWQTGFEMAFLGDDYAGGRPPAKDDEEAAQRADRYAECYGATRTKGQWGRQIGIYDMELDRTVRWQCPDCKHEWK